MCPSAHSKIECCEAAVVSGHSQQHFISRNADPVSVKEPSKLSVVFPVLSSMVISVSPTDLKCSSVSGALISAPLIQRWVKVSGFCLIDVSGDVLLEAQGIFSNSDC